MQARLFHLTFPYKIPQIFKDFWEILDIVDVSLPQFLSDFLFCSLPTYFEELHFSFSFMPILYGILVCWNWLSNVIQMRFPHIQCYDCGVKGHFARLCSDKKRNKCGRCLAGIGDWGKQGEHHTNACKQCFDCGEPGHWAHACSSLQRKRCGNCKRGCGDWGKQGMHHTRHCRQKEENTNRSKRIGLFTEILLYASYWYFPEGGLKFAALSFWAHCLSLTTEFYAQHFLNQNSHHESGGLVPLWWYRLWWPCTDTIHVTRLFHPLPREDAERFLRCVYGDLIRIWYSFVLLSCTEAQQTGLWFVLHTVQTLVVWLIDAIVDWL